MRRLTRRAALVTAAVVVLAVAVTIAALASWPHSRQPPAASRVSGSPAASSASQEALPAIFPASSLAPADGALLGASVQAGAPGRAPRKWPWPPSSGPSAAR